MYNSVKNDVAYFFKKGFLFKICYVLKSFQQTKQKSHIKDVIY